MRILLLAGGVVLFFMEKLKSFLEDFSGFKDKRVKSRFSEMVRVLGIIKYLYKYEILQ